MAEACGLGRAAARQARSALRGDRDALLHSIVGNDAIVVGAAAARRAARRHADRIAAGQIVAYTRRAVVASIRRGGTAAPAARLGCDAR
eukprot:gene10525-5612_t